MEEEKRREGDWATEIQPQTSNLKLQIFWNFELFGTLCNGMLNSPEEPNNLSYGKT